MEAGGLAALLDRRTGFVGGAVFCLFVFLLSFFAPTPFFFLFKMSPGW